MAKKHSSTVDKAVREILDAARHDSEKLDSVLLKHVDLPRMSDARQAVLAFVSPRELSPEGYAELRAQRFQQHAIQTFAEILGVTQQDPVLASDMARDTTGIPEHRLGKTTPAKSDDAERLHLQQFEAIVDNEYRRREKQKTKRQATLEKRRNLVRKLLNQLPPESRKRRILAALCSEVAKAFEKETGKSISSRTVRRYLPK